MIFFSFQTLPIFLDALVTAWGAILISVTLILLFGEVRLASPVITINRKTASEHFSVMFMYLSPEMLTLIVGFTVTADYTSVNLFTLWFGHWCNSGSVRPCPSLCLLTCCVAD